MGFWHTCAIHFNKRKGYPILASKLPKFHIKKDTLFTFKLFVYILTTDFSYFFTFWQLISAISLHFDSWFQLFVCILTADFSHLFTI